MDCVAILQAPNIQLCICSSRIKGWERTIEGKDLALLLGSPLLLVACFIDDLLAYPQAKLCDISLP